MMELKEFIAKLKGYFENNDGEWIDVYVTPSKRVDVTIVSDRFNDRNNSKQFIKQAFEQMDENYSEGFSSYYTLEDAELLEIEKPKRDMDKEISWEKAAVDYINAYQGDLCKENLRSSKIISFYSYKGGVGRTVALIHTAYLLAKKGQNVLLMDLDLEAPSLYDIFEEKLDIEHGLVDYLYDLVMGHEERIKISQIFSKITFNETLKGNIYVIPSGLLSPEYVFKLKQLQPNLVSQSDYLNELLEELEETLNLDKVLIDSRTGLNEWGAFSLLDIADEVMLFSYPNRENIRGLRLIVDLMKTTSCQKLTIVFSRIDPDGMESARDLYEELDLDQEFISIIYNSRLAIASEYPVMSALKEFQPLADYILEDELEKINSFYLQKNPKVKESSLRSLLDAEVDFFLSEPEVKFEEKNNWFIVGGSKVTERIVNIYGYRKRYLVFKDNSPLGFADQLFIRDEENIGELLNYITKHEVNDWTKVWLAYYLYLLNEMDLVKGIEKLKGKKIGVFFNYAENVDIVEMVNLLQKATIAEMITDQKQKVPVAFVRDTIIVLENLVPFKEEVGWLKGLYNSINVLKKNGVFNISVKVMVTEGLYQEFKEEFNTYKGNVLILDWKKQDIAELIFEYLQEGLFGEVNDFAYAIRRTNSFKDFLRCLERYRYEHEDFPTEPDNIIGIEEDEVVEEKVGYGDHLFSLFWGFRVKRGKYSQPMIDWFFEKLQSTGKVNPLRTFEVLKRCIAIELDTERKDRLEYSLVGMESLKRAFEES